MKLVGSVTPPRPPIEHIPVSAKWNWLPRKTRWALAGFGKWGILGGIELFNAYGKIYHQGKCRYAVRCGTNVRKNLQRFPSTGGLVRFPIWLSTQNPTSFSFVAVTSKKSIPLPVPFWQLDQLFQVRKRWLTFSAYEIIGRRHAPYAPHCAHPWI